MKRMERRGFNPEALIARSASTTSAALQPLSSAPVPSSQESRCAPRMTNSSGFSLPLISAITLAVLIGPPIWLGMLRSAHTGCPEASRRPMRSPSSRATSTCGMRSISPSTEFVWR